MRNKLNLQLFARKPSSKPVTKKEMTILRHALNTDLTEAQREEGFIVYEYGGHRYSIVINGFDSYTVIKKQALDESAEYYDTVVYRGWEDDEEIDSL